MRLIIEKHWHKIIEYRQTLDTVQDITERKLANEKIKQSEEKYRSLVENSPEIILIINSDERIEFLNFASQRYDQQKIIGDSLYNYVHERHHQEIKLPNERLLSGEVKYETYETQGTDINGKTQYFQTHIGPNALVAAPPLPLDCHSQTPHHTLRGKGR